MALHDSIPFLKGSFTLIAGGTTNSCSDMLPALFAAAVEAGPIVLLPASMVVGVIGYNVEGYIRRNKVEKEVISVHVS